MATIEILRWKEGFVGLPDEHSSKLELNLWLRRGIKASPREVKHLARQIDARQVVALHNVHDEAVYKLTNILERIGADFHVSADFDNSKRFFKNAPPR